MMEFGLVALWLAVFLLLGFLARPIAAWLLPGMDHAALAFPVALAVLGIVGHLVGQIAFGWPALLAGLVVLVGSAYALGGTGQYDTRRFGEAAAVFTAAFLLVVLIRGFDPAAAPLPIAIGEKFLDFGLVRSLGRASALPPEDMWFAGEGVRYYYGGHMLTALLATLTGTGSQFAYNLGLAGFYATLVTAAYGLAGSIAAPYDVSRRVAAGFGAFFVGIAGNLETTARVVAWLLPDSVAGWLAGWLGLGQDVVEWTPGEFGYFDASRVVPVDPTAQDPFMAATEFPLFSWLNGDLHAHMMSQPFMVLVAALLLAYWRCRDRPRRRAMVLFGALPPLVGFLAVVNVWSFPTAGGLALLAVLFAPGDPIELLPKHDATGWLRQRLSRHENWLIEEGRRLALALVATVVVLVLGVVWSFPFWDVILSAGPGKSVSVWEPWSPLGGLVLVHGAFLAIFAPYLARRLGVEVESPGAIWFVGLAMIAAALSFGVAPLGLALPVGLGAWWLLRTQSDVGYELVLVLAGVGLVVIVELLTVEGERFNVIFKAYAHVWLLWAIAGGVALARLADGWPSGTLEFDRPRWQTTGRALAAVLVVSTSLYAGLALPAHVDNASATADAEGPTLDATAYLEIEYPREAAAIRWLDARDGRPTIVTAAPGGYWWRPSEGDGASAPASLTGVPTVLGWFHERQYRGPDPYQERLGDVESIYLGPADLQRELLAQYNIEYVYVGPAERATYAEMTVGDLDAVTVEKQW
ncbi:MAG: YYY domain-containing protein, partial [Haloarculaceae archaeon]